MEQDSHTDEQIRSILSLNNVAVVGMSKNPSKAAHYVPKYLLDHDYNVIPVNPNSEQILGKQCYALVSEIGSSIDIVNVFRPSEQILPFILDAIKKKPKVIWLQEGIHNLEAEDLVRKEGIEIVFNRCMFAEHRRLSK